MNEPKFTPGPWRWADWTVNASESEAEDLADRLTLEAAEGGEAPQVYDPYTELSPLIIRLSDPAENVADLRLIAAAPDLFAACKWALDILTEGCPDGECWTEAPYHFLWAALNKALGEPETPKS